MDKLHSDLKGRVHFIDEAMGYKEVTRSPKDTQLRNSKAHEALLFRNYTSSNISSALKLRDSHKWLFSKKVSWRMTRRYSCCSLLC